MSKVITGKHPEKEGAFLKEYDPGMGKSTLVSFIIAIVVVTGVLSAAFILPNIPTETVPTHTTNDTTTRTTPPPNGGNNFGPLAAEYLINRREDVEFYWIYNCTFVNLNISHFYQQSVPSAYVDGIKMWSNATSAFIQVLFSPYHENIIGLGEISLDEWNTLAGSLINNGLQRMDDAASHPDDFFNSPGMIDFLVEVYFTDNTYFSLGFKDYYGVVYINNATWSGGFSENGWPIHEQSYSGYWLEEGGHLRQAMIDFFNAITQSVTYPET